MPARVSPCVPTDPPHRLEHVLGLCTVFEFIHEPYLDEEDLSDDRSHRAKSLDSPYAGEPGSEGPVDGLDWGSNHPRPTRRHQQRGGLAPRRSATRAESTAPRVARRCSGT